MCKKRKSRIIRLFISSTFIDMDVERQLIQREVVPQVKEYCMARGWQFEVVDLRWGVSAEAAAHHRTMRICLNELQHCRDVSPKPNFLLLLGQRYGWVPLPETICEEDVISLLNIATDYERDIFNQWYLRNDNTLPCTYELRPELDCENYHRIKYTEAEKVLRPLFDRCVRLFENEIWREHYCASATEQEIVNGLLHHKELYDNAVFYDRILTRIPEEAQSIYIDGQNKNDLTNLRNRINTILPEENTYREQITYNEYKSEDFACRFVNNLVKHLKTVIGTEIDACTYFDDQYEEELGQQGIIEMAAESFVGRQEELNELNAYLQSDKDNELCVINAAPGLGKTMLLAYFLHIQASRKPLYRFIGNSWLSSSGMQIMHSLLSILGITFKKSENYLSLSRKCATYLRNIVVPQMVVIDGLDYLRSDDPMLDMAWLPNPLPKYLKVIISKSPENQIPLLNAYRLRFVQLKPIEARWIDATLQRQLAKQGRCLSNLQRTEILNCYNQVGQQPFLVPIIRQLALEWRSEDEIQLPEESVEGCMIMYLDNLCRPENHDWYFVALVLGLLCYTQYGVTEEELLEITASDDSFYKRLLSSSYHRLEQDTTHRKTPYVIWSKLYSDFKTFIIQRKTNSGITFVFANRSIAQYSKRYIEQHFHIKDRIYCLVQKYFERDITFRNPRTLEELSHAYFCGGKNEELADLLCNPNYVQAKCAHAMVEDLCNEIKDALEDCRIDSKRTLQLKRVQNFLLEQKIQLIKYARYGNTVSERLAKYNIECEQECLSSPLKRVLTLPISNTNASTVVGGLALICCYPQGDSKNSYSTCLLWNIEHNLLYRHIDIPLNIYIGRNSYTTSNLVCSTISYDGRIAVLYDNSKVLWLWETDSNKLRNINIEIQSIAFGYDNSLYYLHYGSVYKFDEINGHKKIIFVDDVKFIWLYADKATQSLYAFDTNGTVACFNEVSSETTILHLPIRRDCIQIVYFDIQYHRVWYYYEKQPCSLYVLDLENKELLKQFDLSSPIDGMYVSPLGNQILYVAEDEFKCIKISDGRECFRLQTAQTRAVLKIGSCSIPQYFFSITCYDLTLWQWMDD